MLYRFFMCFLLASPSLAQHSADTLVIATYQYAENPRIKNLEPFAKELAMSSGISTRVVSYPNVDALLRAMKRSEIDVVFINTFGYLLYKSKYDQYRVAANLSIPVGIENAYQSVIVASRNSGIKNFNDVRKQHRDLDVLFVNPGSTSGNLFPRLKFAAEGFTSDRSFKTVSYTTNHALTLRLVAQGKAALGAFGSEEYDKAMISRSPMADSVTLLWRSQAIPLGPVMYHEKLEKDLVHKLVQSLLTLHQRNSSALQSIKDAWTEAKHATHFQPITEKFYKEKIDLSSPYAIRIIEQFAK